MENNTHTIIETITDAMACVAFAENGAPCPLDRTEDPVPPTAHGKSLTAEIVDTMACEAFAEVGDPCPR